MPPDDPSAAHGVSASHYLLRAATAEDSEALLKLWASLFDDDAPASTVPWRDYARMWLAQVVADGDTARIPIITVADRIVATAVGKLEVGVPNPFCPRGRTVRLANLITLPQHRGNGYGTLLVRDIVQWARSIDADRVDLSATPAGQRIYQREGFALTSAPRLKLVL